MHKTRPFDGLSRLIKQALRMITQAPADAAQHIQADRHDTHSAAPPARAQVAGRVSPLDRHSALRAVKQVQKPGHKLGRVHSLALRWVGKAGMAPSSAPERQREDSPAGS
jgi:hypothetical protein